MQLEKEILSFEDPNLNKLDSYTVEIIPRAWWQLVFGEKFSFCSCCADHQAILPQVDRALKTPLIVRTFYFRRDSKSPPDVSSTCLNREACPWVAPPILKSWKY